MGAVLNKARLLNGVKELMRKIGAIGKMKTTIASGELGARGETRVMEARGTTSLGIDSSRVLRVGMIGTGNICLQHAQAICNSAYPVEIVALCNHNPEKLQAFPQMFEQQCSRKLCAGECQLFTDVDAMLQQTDLDLVYVTTPHPTHIDMALPVVKHGIHCMIEKPLDISLKKAQQLQQAAEKSGAYIGVIAQSRFFPAVERIKNYLEHQPQDAAVTGIVNVMAWRDENYYKSNKWRGKWSTEGGGVLVNQSVHELDLLCFFLGKVKQVYGIWRNINHPYIEVDDTAQAVVTFESGAVANILVSNSVNPAYKNYVRVITAQGHTLSITTHEGVEENAGLAPYEFTPYNDVFSPVDSATLQGWREHEISAAGDKNTIAKVSTEANKVSSSNSHHHLCSKAQSLDSGAQASCQMNNAINAPSTCHMSNAANSPFPFFTLQFENFAQAILEQRPELIRSNLDTSLGCMQIFQGIYLSSKLGCPVSSQEIMEQSI